ncbi:unnamed protein product [Tuber melanosporum]|jgi:tropomyosin|uniref:(Perigord truffle) hypothetical protein n=1 Tax=Tuber melanosporum (strain Mel28) TaxID=656061 RepID=D5GKI3_TUBMM|nr:uncharacterized protein GSTUM_00009572001 [Tuber melanosporum]KAG0138403.1 tropomyosin [Tuber indicum]CAZ85026.1 unnamed protein product [Tuber melanosporum]
MEKVKEKMIALRAEVDDVQTKNDELQARIKVLEQENLQKEQEITSLNHQKNLLEADVEKLETRLKEEKEAHVIGSNNSQEMQNLQRKVALLEEEAEEAEKNLRETNEKLRLTDVKAEHYERKVATLEAEKDALEKKYDETVEMSKKAAHDLEELQSQLESI